MSWLIYIVFGYFVYRIITTAIESERDTKVARAEAEMKVRLVEQLRDPELVRKIVEAKLDFDREEGTDSSIHVRVSSDAGAGESAECVRKIVIAGHPRRHWLILPGLVSFLLGGAFLGLYFLGGRDPSYLTAGAIVGAVGWAFLAYGVFATDYRRHEREAEIASDQS